MPITHIGSTTKSTASYDFHLNNIMLVPKSSHNLLSVHKFTSDNNCSITFDLIGFSVKDLSSGRITLQEPHKDGLYPMHFLHQHNYKALSSQIPTAATWHRRLAHPSFQVLQKVCQNTCFIIYY